MNKVFSIKKAFAFGWEEFKKNVGLWLGIVLVLFIINIIFDRLGYHVDPQTGEAAGSIFGSILGWIVGIVVTVGIITIAVKVVRKQKNEFADLFTSCDSLKKFGNMLAVNILVSIIVVIGLILLIVPGVIASLMFFLAPYYVVTQNMGPIDAMKRSAKATKGHKMQLFLFTLASIGVMLLGALALLVGLFVAIPVVIIASAYVYDRLTKGDSSEEIKDAEIIEDTKQDVLDPVIAAQSK